MGTIKDRNGMELIEAEDIERMEQLKSISLRGIVVFNVIKEE